MKIANPRHLPVTLVIGLIVCLSANGYCDYDLAMVSDSIYNDISHQGHKKVEISSIDTDSHEISSGLKGLNLSFGGNGKDEGVSIATCDDGYIIVGTSYSSDIPGFNGGLSDIYVVRINGQGKKLWERMIGSDRTDRATAAVGLPDGSCIIAGTTVTMNLFDNEALPVPGSADIHVWKTSNTGDLVWENQINNDDAVYHPDDYGRSLALASDTRVLVLGHSWANTDIWINILDTDSGSVVSEKRINAESCTYDPKSITRTSDNGFLLTGECGLNAFAMKLDSSYDIIWETVFSGNSLDSLYAGVELDDGYLFVGGTTSTFRQVSTTETRKIVPSESDIRDQEMYVVKTDKNGKTRTRLWNYPLYEAPINTEWEIGIGWLESGWSDISMTATGSGFENDCAYQIARRFDGTCLVMGTGACHENGAGVAGRGQLGQIENGALLMSINPNAQARDSIKDDAIFTWEDQFKKECLQWKKIHTDITSVRSYAEIDQGYLLLGSDKNNDMKLIAVRSDGSRF